MLDDARRDPYRRLSLLAPFGAIFLFLSSGFFFAENSVVTAVRSLGAAANEGNDTAAMANAPAVNAAKLRRLDMRLPFCVVVVQVPSHRNIFTQSV